MKKFFKSTAGMSFVIVFCFISLLTCGCGDPKASGRITFSDGSPLTTGLVCFESEMNTYYGDVKPNGTFSMGKTKNGQGIPPGEYKVFFQNAQEQIGADDENRPIYKNLLDDKFYSASTSDLTCKVNKKTRMDIQVTGPK